MGVVYPVLGFKLELCGVDVLAPWLPFAGVVVFLAAFFAARFTALAALRSAFSFQNVAACA